MRVRIAVLFVVTLLMPAFIFAQGAKPTAKTPPASHAIVKPDQLA